MQPLSQIAVLGAGSMAGAILRGLIAAGTDPASVTVTTRSEASAEAWKSAGVHAIALEKHPDANADAVRGARVVLLGVKPAMVPDTLRDVADALEPDALVVSVAAGVTTATMESLVPNAVVRAMPNTPALVGRAVTGVAAGSRAGDAELATARALFEAVGTVVDLPEARIDAVSTISGSGPAYVFFLIERLTDTARNLGFDEPTARLLVEETFRGASELLAASDVDPAELRRRVTSPKGTTERAITVLEAADLTSTFDEATAAALARAKELSQG